MDIMLPMVDRPKHMFNVDKVDGFIEGTTTGQT